MERTRPDLTAQGRGVNHPAPWEPGVDDEHEYHPHDHAGTPPLVPVLKRPAPPCPHPERRLEAACTSGALKTLPVRQGDGKVGASSWTRPTAAGTAPPTSTPTTGGMS